MRANRLICSITVALLAALGTGLLSPSAAHAADKPKPKPGARITFGLQPATKGAPDARPSYRYSVTPGGTMRDQVAVRNLSATPVTFQVYATDAVNVDNGGFGLLPRTQRPRDVGTWVTVGPRGFKGSVTVKAKSDVILPLALKVPLNAQPGDHTGGVVVSVTTQTKNAEGTNTVLEQRIGARMFIRVSGPARPSLTIKPVRPRYEDLLNPVGRGQTKVTYRITNTGNINLGGRQRLTVRGLVGPTQVSVKIPDATLLLPGGSIDVATSVRRTWPLIRARATVTVDPLVQEGDLVTTAPFSASAGFWAVPWALFALLLLLALAIWIRSRIRRGRAPKPPSGGASGDSMGTTPPRASQHAAGQVGAATTLTFAAMIALASPAMAADPPYTDPAATGGITLCDAKGGIKTSGSLTDPLAATVVGASPATAPYDGEGRAAGLFAYQPRKGVEPGEWSGQGLTALSRYTNAEHPMAEILPADYTVGDFVQAFAPQWDGMIQLRMYLRVPNQPVGSTSYSATSLKVSGDSWQQVGASAGGICKAGKATSVARLLGLSTDRPTAAPTSGPSPATPAPPATAAALAGASPTTSGTPSVAGGASSTGVTPGASAVAEGPVAAATDEDGGLVVWVLPVGLLFALALVAWLWGRRRGTTAVRDL